MSKRLPRALLAASLAGVISLTGLATGAVLHSPATAHAAAGVAAPPRAPHSALIPAGGQSSPPASGDSPAYGGNNHVTVQNTSTMYVPSYTPEGSLLGISGWSIGYGCLIEHPEVCGAIVSPELSTALSNVVKYGGMGAIAILTPKCVAALSHFVDPTAATGACASLSAWLGSKFKGIGPYCLFLPNTPPEWRWKVLTVYCGLDNSPPTN